jgi:methionyl-tRNA formyltransferase
LSQGGYFGGRKAEDGRIDWSRSAAVIHNLVRAVAPPYPGAFSDTARGRLRILRTLTMPGRSTITAPALFAEAGELRARCGDGGVLRLLAAELNGLAITADLLGNDTIPLT